MFVWIIEKNKSSLGNNQTLEQLFGPDSDDSSNTEHVKAARTCLGEQLYKKTRKDMKSVDKLIDSGVTMNERTHEVTNAHAGYMLNEVQYCTLQNESLTSIARKLKMGDQNTGPVILWLMNNDVYDDLPYPKKGCRSCSFMKRTILYVPQDVGKEYKAKGFFRQPFTR